MRHLVCPYPESMLRLADNKIHLGCLQNAPQGLRKMLRSTIIDLVLATDMKQHFNLISKFQVRGKWPAVNVISL